MGSTVLTDDSQLGRHSRCRSEVDISHEHAGLLCTTSFPHTALQSVSQWQMLRC